MEVLRIYLPAILIAVFNFECPQANEHDSALITQVIKIPNGVSSAKLIECAFRLMKTEEKYFVRIATGTDVCEELDRRPPSLMDSSFYTEGFEYLQKSSVCKFFENPKTYQEKVAHYIYSKVEIGDTFNFVFQKLNTDKFYITFRNTTTTYTTHVLMFTDDSTQLILKDSYNNQYGEESKPVYPFQDFKIYKIRFEVLEPYWQISVNDKLLTTFHYRLSLEHIARINIKCGSSVKYLSKAFNPRNQPQNITGW